MPIKYLFKVGLASAAFLALSVTGATAAPDIPCGTAKLIVPWGAGGGTDIIFRQIVDKVNKNGAKPQLQVVNVGGQGGNKGAKQAAKAKPDGCTLFAIHQSAITSYFTGRIDITWDAFEPVSMVTSTPSIIGANVNTPFNNLTDLVAAAKKDPGSITAGGTFGSTSQFVFLLLEDAAGVKFKHVSYDGTKQRMTALLADNIKLGEINLAAPKLVTKEMIKLMKRGSVIVDVAIDQGGCVETSKPTTHSEPTYIVDDVVHYCVANMPGGVPRTSTIALNKATLPYLLKLANNGYQKALSEDKNFLAGLNVHKGNVTYKAVADVFGHVYVDPGDAIKN